MTIVLVKFGIIGCMQPIVKVSIAFNLLMTVIFKGYRMINLGVHMFSQENNVNINGDREKKLEHLLWSNQA